MADVEKAGEISEVANGVPWITEGQLMVQQIVEESKLVLQAAMERAAAIEAESEWKAQRIAEETKRAIQAQAEEEAQHTIEMAKEEAQHVIQVAMEETVAAIARENDALLRFMKGVRNGLGGLNEMAGQRATSSGEAESAESVGPQAQPAWEELLPPY